MWRCNPSNLCITDAAFIELTRENEQHKDEITLHGELITDIYHYKCALTQLTLTYFMQSLDVYNCEEFDV